MSENPSPPKFIFGLHEPGGEYLMEEAAKKGWILFTHALGRDPNDRSGQDYRPWSARGFGIIARLNHGYGTAGTIPLPEHYSSFARRVSQFVANSAGCHIWIIGNEMNHGQERPDGQPIIPEQYASCYAECWQGIHSLPGREDDQVVVGPVAPWNNTTAYPGNEGGDWVRYFSDVIAAIQTEGAGVDAIALHTYTHGHDPNLISSEQRMNPPFQNRHYNFRCYRDFMAVIPEALRRIPVYITETNQEEAWEDANRGWVQNAYREINDWNATVGNQQIRALILYRWPRYDKWYIDTKDGVHDDLRTAMQHDYVWREIQAPVRINGYLIQGAFLDFYYRAGQAICGLPISDELQEDGLPTQYFERLVLQQNASGTVVLKKVGTEVVALREAVRQSDKQIRVLRCEVNLLKDQLATLETQVGTEFGRPSKRVIEIPRPMWENVVYHLPRHSTERYATRDMSALRYLVINHSAVPGTYTAQQIADFHVNHMNWPGIGYHFYVDGAGLIHKTNELTTTCHHAGKWDPIGVGFCVGGDFTDDIPTQAQLQSLAHLLAWMLQDLDLPLNAVRGKKEFLDTQSPGRQWLEGRNWKNLLIEEIHQARVRESKPHLPKTLYHYLLLRHDGSSQAEEEWQNARAYISRFRVTHGFSVEDARTAKFVTIVGGIESVDRATEQILVGAGCRVERIAGRTPAETSQILTDMAKRGQQFLSLTPKSA